MAVLSTARADRVVDVWAGVGRGADGQPAVTVAWTPRTAAGRTDPSRTVSLAVKGAGGDRAFEASVADGAISFPSPAGTLQLQLTVRDASGNIVDEDRRAFSVPDLSATALTVSAPVVLRARTVTDARALAEGRQAAPFAGREFNRTDRVFVRFSVYGASASAAAVSARLTTRAGAPLLELALAKMSDADAAYQIDVPIASIARGDYLIAVAAAHGEESTRALVPLRIVP